jgi:hypothetical protein
LFADIKRTYPPKVNAPSKQSTKTSWWIAAQSRLLKEFLAKRERVSGAWEHSAMPGVDAIYSTIRSHRIVLTLLYLASSVVALLGVRTAGLITIKSLASAPWPTWLVFHLMREVQASGTLPFVGGWAATVAIAVVFAGTSSRAIVTAVSALVVLCATWATVAVSTSLMHWWPWQLYWAAYVAVAVAYALISGGDVSKLQRCLPIIGGPTTLILAAVASTRAETVGPTLAGDPYDRMPGATVPFSVACASFCFAALLALAWRSVPPDLVLEDKIVSSPTSAKAYVASARTLMLAVPVVAYLSIDTNAFVLKAMGILQAAANPWLTAEAYRRIDEALAENRATATMRPVLEPVEGLGRLQGRIWCDSPVGAKRDCEARLEILLTSTGPLGASFSTQAYVGGGAHPLALPAPSKPATDPGGASLDATKAALLDLKQAVTEVRAQVDAGAVKMPVVDVTFPLVVARWLLSALVVALMFIIRLRLSVARRDVAAGDEEPWLLLDARSATDRVAATAYFATVVALSLISGIVTMSSTTFLTIVPFPSSEPVLALLLAVEAWCVLAVGWLSLSILSAIVILRRNRDSPRAASSLEIAGGA